MNPNKFHAIRALHVFRSIIEEFATNCATPLMTHVQRELCLFLLESAADAAHAAYALYHDPVSDELRHDFEKALRRADELYAKHTTGGYQPYRILLENLATLTEPIGESFGGADVLPSDDAAPSVDTTAWRALELLLKDVDQTVAYGLAADVDHLGLLMLYIGLQLPAGLVRCAFEALDGEGDERADAADAIDQYNALREDAFRIRSSLALPLTVHDYPVMPTKIY
jgi:hypothetical protein